MGLIGKIFIIQSLRFNDIKSGELLKNNIENIIPTVFKKIENRNDLFHYLENIKSDCPQPKSVNVIHFDCHGNEDGIAIFDNNDVCMFVEWSELRLIFREIYKAFDIKPIISFSCCKGINVMKLLAEFEPCPYNLVTGSLEDIPFMDSIHGYSLFYKNLNDVKPLDENINDVRNAFPSLDFFAFNADTLCEKAWMKYKETKLTPEVIEARKVEIRAEVIKMQNGKPFTAVQERQLNANLTIESGELDYQRFRKIFYSEN